VTSLSRKHRLRALAVATALAFCTAPVHAGQADLSGLQAEQQYDRFIVRLHDTGFAKIAAAQAPIEDVLASVNRGLVAKAGGAASPFIARHLRPMALGADVVTSSRRLGADEARALMEAIAAHPDVAAVEVDSLMQADFIPDDTYYGLQWGYFDADAGIRAEQAWDIANGEGIVVAVLDTGITNHSDLNANIVPGYDMIWDPVVAGDGDGRDADPNDPGDYYTRPSSWHGSHVAGTVAAVTHNAKGVAGTAWGARVMPVRVLGRGGGYTSDIADGVTWASGGDVPGVPSLEAARVADIINMSLGGTGACGIMQAAVDGAVARGTTVVVSAGNDNFDAINKRPANCNGVIAVASITSSSARSSFSNFGSVVDIAAPGSSIASTINTGTTAPVAEAYAYYSGTSMAAPHVAGALALAQSRRLQLGRPLWTPAEAEGQLKATSYPMAVPCPEDCGAGIADAYALVTAAGGAALGYDLALYAGSPAPIVYARQASFTITVRNRSSAFAYAPSVMVSVSNNLQSIALQAPEGWTCTEVAALRARRDFRCDHLDDYPANDSDVIRFDVQALRSTTVSYSATASAAGTDLRPANNKASGSFTVGMGYY